jgi:pyruvate-ferredoxin/flavodoxin oxidoreductase
MKRARTVEFPGTSAVMDGSEAVADVEVRIAEGACAYPITPSTNMAGAFQAAVADGRTNLWGTPLRFLELESEHSSASAAEGFAMAGGRVVNFTSGQGLVLMKEVLFVISGKRLPAVFHVGARALTSQALNIHAGHDDLMAVADTGWGMLVARNAQEAADLSAIARRVAEECETPFFVAQDGFLTTHTLETLHRPEDELLRRFVGDPRTRLRDLLSPKESLMSGVVENQDAYMKGRIGQRAFYARIPGSLATAFAEWERLTGRQYGPIRTHRTGDAEQIVVSMGSMAETAEAVVDRLREAGNRVGSVAITAFRPFPAVELAEAVRRATAVAVIERTDEPAAADNPLTRELKAALAGLAADGARIPRVVSASAGLGSRDVAGADIAAVLAWAADPVAARERPFAVLGVVHPLGLERVPIDVTPPGAYRLRGHSIGGFGSVTTNKVLATLVGELFGLHVQAYPRYGSEKKGLPTTYFLTIADEPIRSHGEIQQVDFVPLYDLAAFRQGNVLAGLVDGGAVFVQTPLSAAEDIWQAIPVDIRDALARRNIHVWALDTAALARRHAPRPELEIRMQGVALAGVFLRVAPFATRAGLDVDALMLAVRRQLERFFGKRGEAVVEANLAVVREAYDGVIDVTAAIGAAAGQVLAGAA